MSFGHAVLYINGKRKFSECMEEQHKNELRMATLHYDRPTDCTYPVTSQQPSKLTAYVVDLCFCSEEMGQKLAQIPYCL